MLERVCEIDWGQFFANPNHGEEMRSAILGLASESSVVRVAARDRLWNITVHQGTVYEMAVPTVPFLVELLRQPSCPNAGDLLDLLKIY